MPNNDEKPRKTWIMIRRAKPLQPGLKFYTKDKQQFMTADGQEFLVRE